MISLVPLSAEKGMDITMKRTIVIDNVCGWPNLTRMPDGSLISVVFNHPSHGEAEAEVDCYRSDDEGATWRYHGTPAQHDPTCNRMNAACGIAVNGDFLVLVGGWDRRPAKGEAVPPYEECNRLPAVVCRSADNGRTFKVSPLHYTVPGDDHVLVPYGDIFRIGGSTLACACYTVTKDMEYTRSYVIFSDDDGFTWTRHGLISGNNHHETALWFHDKEHGIAICRENACDRLDQFTTEDGGQTWQFDQQITCPGILPAHVMKLDNGQLLMTCGVRIQGLWGIGVSCSKDGGKNWSRLRAICNFGELKDGGYPTSVQLDNGEIVTHYYASGIPFHERYFVGQVKWNFGEVFE